MGIFQKIVGAINPVEIVKKVAPTLGLALGGPFGGMATKFLADKLLGKPDASEADVEQAILNADPETLSKLKQLDQEFATKMRELDIDIFRLEVEDRASARELFKVNIWPQIVLSAVFVIGYFVIFFLLLGGTVKIDADNSWLQGMFATILGVLTAAIPQILGFWFGSSLGSKEKTRGIMDTRGH